MDAHDVLSPGRSYELQLAERLGGGGQADVYRARVPALPGRWALKRYRTGPKSGEGRHLVAFTRYCLQCSDLANGSVSLPRYVVVDEHGAVGCLVPELSGEALSEDLYTTIYDDPRGLRFRLRLGVGFAGDVASLHAHGITHADLGEPNLIADLTRERIAVSDTDGGGVLVSEVGTVYRDDLSPLVRGHWDGSLLAPELIEDAQRVPDLASDRWALASILHRILFGGLDAFFHADLYPADLVSGVTTWPPRGDGSVWLAFHLTERQRLGQRLVKLFASTFAWRPGDPYSLATRTKASIWQHELDLASRWVVACQRCGEQFVGHERTDCPFCRADLQHPRIWTQKACIELNREGKTLLGRDLRFTDHHDGRYEIMSFIRDNDGLLLLPRVDISIDGCDFPRDQLVSVKLDPARYCEISARSKDGRQTAHFRLEIPACAGRTR